MTTDLAQPADLTYYQAGHPYLMLQAAQAAVRSYCRWHVAPEVTETVTVFDGFSGDTLVLPTQRLTDVVSVTVDGTVMDLTTLTWSQSGFIRWLSPTAPPTARPVAAVVEMTHGFDPIPADLQAVVLAIAARGLAAAPVGNLKSKTVGQVSESYATGSDGLPSGIVLADVERWVLDRYRLISA